MTTFQYTHIQLEALKKKDKTLAKAIEEIGLIDRKTNLDIFSSLIENIVSQQISTSAAKSVTARLTNLVGTITPETINQVSIDDIQACGMTFRKANYIKEAARVAIDKEIDFDQLKELTDEEVIKKLISLKGIGIWTAEMLLIFSLHRYDILSYDDLGIRRGIMKLYNKKELTKKDFLKYKKRYSPYGSIASLYLWHISKED